MLGIQFSPPIALAILIVDLSVLPECCGKGRLRRPCLANQRQTLAYIGFKSALHSRYQTTSGKVRTVHAFTGLLSLLSRLQTSAGDNLLVVATCKQDCGKDRYVLLREVAMHEPSEIDLRLLLLVAHPIETDSMQSSQSSVCCSGLSLKPTSSVTP